MEAGAAAAGAANSPRTAGQAIEPMPINASLPRIWLRLVVKVADATW